MKFSTQSKTIITLLLLMITCTVVAQNKQPIKIKGEKAEEKINQNTYLKFDQGDYVFMYNKNNLLINTYTSFYENRSSFGSPKYSLSDRSLLDSYVKKWITPHLGDTKNYDEKNIRLEITLFSDIDGNVKEIAVTYLAECKLPLSSIESLETDILSSNVKVIFDKNIYPFRDATWVEYPLRYSLTKLKKMTAE